MGKSNNYLAPLGLAVVGALFGLGHFGGLNDSLFGSDNKTDKLSETYYVNDYEESYSSESYGDISFKGSGKKFVKTSFGCDGCSCSGYWGYIHPNGTYEGACTNTDKWGHKCGHGPEKHGLSKW